MANKRTPSQLDQSPLADMDTGEPTIDELLENHGGKPRRSNGNGRRSAYAGANGRGGRR